MKNLKKISREYLRSVKGGVREGCPGPRSPLYVHLYASQEQCEAATGKVCYYSEETRCFGEGWAASWL